jgi:NADP-dependent 3-hydroxy acid dehydrogenase YdfG
VSFVKSDVSVLKNVDEACQEISKKEPKVNLLFLSAGIMTTKGRTGM